MIKESMEAAITNLKRWVGNHYSNAPNTPLMLQIIEFYLQPLSTALRSIQIHSEWMRHDVRELEKSLRFPWVDIIDPPPQRLTAQQMEERLRHAVKKTRAIWKEQMLQWAREYADDDDPYEVEDEDVHSLRRMADLFANLHILKSEESVRRTMGIVVDACIQRRNRREQRRREAGERQHLRRQLALERQRERIRAERANAQRELESRRITARNAGLRIGMAQPSRDRIQHGMLSAKK